MGKVSQQNQNNSVAVNSSSNKEKAKRRTRKSVPRDAPLQRSSVYRGVTRHRWTGRYEAHLWDKNCWNESQNKKGRQVYLGAYDDEEAAAHAYDLAALKYWGPETILNFPLETYEEELGQMKAQSKEEYIGSLRRKSSGFSRGVSKYRGVARHHHNGRWEARIGRVFGNKYLYLGTYATQEEAATAYDRAAIEYRGLNAVTNFDLSRYINWLRPNADGQSNNGNGSVKSNEDIQLDAGTGNDPVAGPTFQLGFTFLPHHQQCSDDGETDGHSLPPRSGVAASASSALGLLLQSSKFKEMMERTSAVDSPPVRTESTDPPRSSFPDDIQTYFDCQDSSNYTDGDDSIFADLNSFASPIFHCELDG